MKPLFHVRTGRRLAPLGALVALLGAAPLAQAQHGIHSPVTPKQRATAQQAAQAGVPLSALAPDAPDEYTVRRGDTLWGISGKFLRSPWRWPELWGMNLQDIKNPHLIYPGQQLYLERNGDRARLRTRQAADGQPDATVRVSPRNRVEMLDANPLPTLQAHLIEPFLSEPLVVDQLETFERAPRLVALRNQDRVLVVKGDRAYALGPDDAPLLKGAGRPDDYRVFRTAKPLKDPVSGEILGYEGQYVGRVKLARSQSMSDEVADAGYVPPYRPLSGELNTVPDEVRDQSRATWPSRPRWTWWAARKKCAPATACCPSRRASTATTCRTRRPSRSRRGWSRSTATRCALPATTRWWPSTRASATACKAAPCWPCCRPARAWSTRPTPGASPSSCPTSATAWAWCFAPSIACPTCW
jgi:hypothetical protein